MPTKDAHQTLDEFSEAVNMTVIGYVHRHREQPPSKQDVETSAWRYSLMNWGHDPLKD
jgi:hypothetical protein